MKWTTAILRRADTSPARETFFSRLAAMDVNDPDTGGLCKAQLEYVRDALVQLASGDMERFAEWERNVAEFTVFDPQGKYAAKCQGTATEQPPLAINIYGIEGVKDIVGIEFGITTYPNQENNNKFVPDEILKELAKAAGLKDDGKTGSFRLSLGLAFPWGRFHSHSSMSGSQVDPQQGRWENRLDSGIFFHKSDIAKLHAAAVEALSVLKKETMRSASPSSGSKELYPG